MRAPNSTQRRPVIKPNALILLPNKWRLKLEVTGQSHTRNPISTTDPLAKCYLGPPHFAERPECVCQWNYTTVTGMRGHRGHAETRVHKTEHLTFTDNQGCSPGPAGQSRKSPCGVPNGGLYSPCLTISRGSFAFPGSLCY